ncbi:uncharacterized protein LOC102079222 isoform X3 [Oreochromis niloticus]|uniref:uncharacterized protein LOC102079222 isoform X3 n=1 Tax=Oreochromis niloticus TaxID=8128 RepID=UPI000393D6FE|nr:uncharacterized protein LOC102079222 isoform X3 [Oreochromis niloticus]CAI5642533.1 unnamed protein product [Mustela putorius furo]
MDTESPLLSFIKSSLPKLKDPEPLLELLQDLGVEGLEDLSYLQESDRLPVLRPAEVRKLLSQLKKTSHQDVFHSPPSNQQFSRASTSTSPVTRSDEMLMSGLHFIRHNLDSELDEVRTNSSLFDEDDGSMGSGKPEAGELERYLSCPFTGGVDILHGFPHIKKLSIKINTALPASGACEGLLSHAGLLVTAKQLQLHSKNLESKLLLKLNHHLTE